MSEAREPNPGEMVRLIGVPAATEHEGQIGVYEGTLDEPLDVEGTLCRYAVWRESVAGSGRYVLVLCEAIEPADEPTDSELDQIAAEYAEMEPEVLLDPRRVAAVKLAVNQVLRPYNYGQSVLVDPHAVLDIARFLLDEEFTVGRIEYPSKES